MPTELTRIATYLSDDQIAEIERIKTLTHQGNTAHLLRQLLRQYVEANGGTWPQIIPRGKYPRTPSSKA